MGNKPTAYLSAVLIDNFSKFSTVALITAVIYDNLVPRNEYVTHHLRVSALVLNNFDSPKQILGGECIVVYLELRDSKRFIFRE